MAYSRIQHGGGAISTTITADLTSGSTSAAIAASTGWPDGSVGPFYAVLDPGLATEEKILITTRTSLTLNPITRGVDGSSASAHTSGATIQHVFSAVEADEANLVVSKSVGAVTAKGDEIVATGNQALGKLAVGADATVRVADSAQATGQKWAKIVTANITAANVTAAELASSSVTTAKILDANVTTGKIAANAITMPLFGAGLQPVQVCTAATRPGSPTAGMTIFETDTKRYYGYDGAAWVFVESLASGESRVTPQSAAVTGGPAGGADVTLATMVIAAKPFAYTLVCAAFWSAYLTDSGDIFHFTVRVDGVSKGGVVQRAASANHRVAWPVPTTVPVAIAASTASTVTVIAGRDSGSGTLVEENAGRVTGTCYRLNP